ncbi:universal stress protein [Aliiglaciecola sp. LCG003]|uniref:universal stress protein n=1 Tax=Aliiglaciecola sp. LCG003 TaxID=3053655 RepID=UPI00257458B2|nr:universal stress protein [Aliiglaciecola sp. LCG003]WJG07696.1 universal stress protein [Aliiglaciecola sp. LCG003]
MNEVDKILVVIDPDKKDQPALSRALQFGNGQPLSIVLVACLYYPSIESTYILDPQNMDQVRDSMINFHRNKLLTLVHKHQHHNIHIEIEVTWKDSVHIGILQMVEKHQPDLVIKGSHKQSQLTQWLFNSIDRQLLRATPVPLLFVKHSDLPENATVVAAIDPSHRLNKEGELDERILSSAYGIAKQLTLPLHAYHCFDPDYWEILFSAIDEAQIWTDVFPAAANTENSKVLDELRDRHHQQFHAECEKWVPHFDNQHMLDGSITESLPKLLADKNAAMLVIGTAYRTGLLGSTADELLNLVECDLLVIKPAGFKSPFSLE